MKKPRIVSIFDDPYSARPVVRGRIKIKDVVRKKDEIASDVKDAMNDNRNRLTIGNRVFIRHPPRSSRVNSLNGVVQKITKYPLNWRPPHESTGWWEEVTDYAFRIEEVKNAFIWFDLESEGGKV